MRTRSFPLALALLLSPVLAAAPPPGPQGTLRPNVLVLLADDLGVDVFPATATADDLPTTPNLDALVQGGMLFTEAWSNPLCSPTRASILTGRHAFRSGIGDLVFDSTQALDLSELTLPEMLDAGGSGYAHAAIGKWHLGNGTNGGFLSPNLAGFSHFAGTLKNATPSYTCWTKVVDGVRSKATTYATTDQVDEALAWIGAQAEPWCCYVAFNAPHDPYHVPPDGLYTIDLTGLDPTVDFRPHYEAAIEALDHEIGRLLDSLDPGVRARTQVFFLGDNGTPPEDEVPPDRPDHAKGTVYQGGVHVPLVASGPLVARPGTRSGRLVHVVDLYATIAEIAGVDLSQAAAGVHLDSRSFLDELTGAGPGADRARRDFLYTEWFTPNGGPPTDFQRAVRDARFKLLAFPDHEELYDLAQDPLETTDLLLEPLDAGTAVELARLEAELARVLGS